MFDVAWGGRQIARLALQISVTLLHLLALFFALLDFFLVYYVLASIVSIHVSPDRIMVVSWRNKRHFALYLEDTLALFQTVGERSLLQLKIFLVQRLFGL